VQPKIKVLRIIARMNVGGPAVQISNLMGGLNPKIFDQKLITGYCEQDEIDYLELNAPEIPCTRIKGFGRRVSLKEDFLAFFYLAREIKKFKPDYIHTHTAKAGVLGRAAAILMFSRAKLIHTFHGHLLHGYFSPFKTKLVVLVEKLLATRSTILVSVGEQVRDDLLAAGVGRQDQFKIIPPGVNLGVITESHLIRTNLDIPESATVITFLGRITKVKRPDRFAQVALQISKQNPNTYFLIVGSGELEEILKSELSTISLKAKFLGWRNDIENILEATDILLLTSDNEGTPVSAIQAGMAGIPTVSTNVGSVSKIIDDGVSGILTSLNPSEIAEQLQKLITDTRLRQILGERAKVDITEHFSVSQLIKKHEEIYTA
jgi:glycosyltransferase involved in cell wall biosynthesis